MSADRTAGALLDRRRVFAGRARELAVLADELDRARANHLRVVLITGEAGIGKTALATEAVARAGEGALVLTARAHALGATTSFGLWVEALERHLRTLHADEIRRLAGLAAPELAPLLRSVEASSPGGASRNATSYRLVEDLVGLVAGIAAVTPTVVLLDDVHLADAPSWETLHFLARDRPALPVAVLMTARPDELAAHPIANDITFALEQDGVLRRVRLGPLGRDDLDEFARRRSGRDKVPDALVQWLESRSRGNALYAVGLLGALLEEGGDLSNPTLQELPEQLADRVRARLRGLDDDARATLEVLAVLGSRIELADLARVAGRGVEGIAVALERLTRNRLVVDNTTGAMPTFEVAHPLVEETIYQSMGAVRRTALHRAIGRTLFASGQLAAAATHLARSAPVGDAEAVDALIAALGEAEERSSYRAATALLAELVRLLPDGDARWLDVGRAMDPAADWVLAHLAEDDVEDACTAMRRIEPLADQAGDDRLRAVVQLRLGCFGGLGAGQLDDALQACERAAELFDHAGDPVLALAARSESAFVLTVQGRHDEAYARTEELMPAADALRDPLPRMHLLMHRSYQAPFLGRFEEADEAELLGMQLAVESGNHYRRAIFHNRRRWILAFAGRLAEARALPAMGDSPAAVDALAYEAQILVAWLAGDLVAALDALSKARSRNRTTISQRQSMLLVIGVRAAIDADELDGMADLLDRAQQANRGFLGVFAAHPPWGLGVLRWRLGEGSAVGDLRAAAERIRELDSPMESLYFLADLAEAATEQADGAAAAWAAEQAEQAVRRVDRSPLHRAMADLVQALVRRDATQAARAADTFRELGYLLFFGRAQVAHARALASDDPAAAVEVLNRAVLTFRECGARWPEERAVQLLRGLGARGRRAATTGQGPGGLSVREEEVARLAAMGKTAKEIATEMFIGERTVETHLQHVYGKLGVRSKRELVQRADELGLRT